MAEDNYLQWLANATPTPWWHDSGEPVELERGLANGATGVTTNPVLISKTVHSNPDRWLNTSDNAAPQKQTERLTKAVIQNAAQMFAPMYEHSRGVAGYVCAQVNPMLVSDRDAMIQMARRFSTFAPNIAVKLPATAAGLDVLAECIAEGITITATVSFTVPQVIAIAERCEQAAKKARKAGKRPGKCFAVIMIGRIDDYLWDVARDRQASVMEADTKQAGLAITKRAYSIYREKGYEATLIVAAMRGTYHMLELVGAELILSIHPKYQVTLLEQDVPRDAQRINVPIAPEVISKLQTVPEFVRAYEPDGMEPEEFISYGVVQRTLSQFFVGGWSLLETLNQR